MIEQKELKKRKEKITQTPIFEGPHFWRMNHEKGKEKNLKKKNHERQIISVNLMTFSSILSQFFPSLFRVKKLYIYLLYNYTESERKLEREKKLI